MRVWLDDFSEHVQLGLCRALNVRLGNIECPIFREIDSSASRVVVVGLEFDGPGLLSFNYDQELCERISATVFGRMACFCEESELAGALMALTDLLMEGFAEACKRQGGESVVAPAVYCGPISGQGVASCGIPSASMALRTSGGTLTCCLVSQEAMKNGEETEEGHGQRILISAASPLVCRMLARVAVGLGFEVTTAADEASMLAAVEQFQPDVVALDAGLDGLDGSACVRRINKIRPESRVILVSTDGECEGLLTSLVHEACGFVMRPFNGRGFEKQLRRLAALRAERALTRPLPT